MKAISLWQPWATAMALGLKQIETRHWSHNYRGLIAIHAAKRWTREERELAEEFAALNDEPRLLSPPLGAIVAVGVIVSIRSSESLISEISSTEEMFGNYGPNRFGWLFKDIVALAEPVPCKGAQGFFEVPDDLTKITLEQTSRITRAVATPAQGSLFGAMA